MTVRSRSVRNPTKDLNAPAIARLSSKSVRRARADRDGRHAPTSVHSGALRLRSSEAETAEGSNGTIVFRALMPRS